MATAPISAASPRLAELEEQVRFFKAAYGIEDPPPQQIVKDVIAIAGCPDADHKEANVRMMRHVIEQGNRAETAERRARKLHEALLNVSQVVANALQLAASSDRQGAPGWLRSLGSNLDMVLADAALDKR